MTIAASMCDPMEAFAEHQAWLRTVLLARLGSLDEAEEVLQEVAVAAANQSAKREPIERIGPWLYRVALRQVMLFRRKQGRRRKLVANVARVQQPTEVDSDTPSPADWLLSQERNRLVAQVLMQLAERDRQLLMLKYVEDYSYEEIAQRIGITASAVQSRLHRARKLLKQQLISGNIVDSKYVSL